jgi:hypothetical protein
MIMITIPIWRLPFPSQMLPLHVDKLPYDFNEFPKKMNAASKKPIASKVFINNHQQLLTITYAQYIYTLTPLHRILNHDIK